MVFWRNRSAKKAETPVIVEAESAKAEAAEAKTAVPVLHERDPQTNVVTLVTGRGGDRLADRLADVAGHLVEAESKDARGSKDLADFKDPAPIKPVEQTHVFGQQRAAAKIRAALAANSGEHLLILGEPGTGRIALAEALAAEIARAPAPDWLYVVERHAPSRAKAFAVPAGEGPRLRSEIRSAIDKAGIAFARHLKSEDHRISLDLIDEEMRYRGEKAVEQVRRRAETQNIAVVKSLDGYVLAPMHEGRVVRSDVFRALPEALKRNVEAKITTLESELQSIVATLPDVEFEASEKYNALIKQTAMKAIRPSLEPLRRVCTDHPAALAALDAVEEAFVAASPGGVAGEPFAPIALLDVGDDERASENSHVVTVRRAGAADLVGEIGRDALGHPTLLPGALARAGSGFVVVEAWRLAADPAAWLALSAAIACKAIAPLRGSGIAVDADPVPLRATIVLIADPQSWSKLEAIEPGLAVHFLNVAKLATTAPMADLSEDDYAKSAARLAADHGLRPLNPAVAPLIYKDAVRRGGGGVSLARTALLHLLQTANAIADTHSAAQIRAADLAEALSRRADGDAP
jgi:predicted ATP-dependent protease